MMIYFFELIEREKCQIKLRRHNMVKKNDINPYNRKRMKVTPHNWKIKMALDDKNKKKEKRHSQAIVESR